MWAPTLLLKEMRSLKKAQMLNGGSDVLRARPCPVNPAAHEDNKPERFSLLKKHQPVKAYASVGHRVRQVSA